MDLARLPGSTSCTADPTHQGLKVTMCGLPSMGVCAFTCEFVCVCVFKRDCLCMLTCQCLSMTVYRFYYCCENQKIIQCIKLRNILTGEEMFLVLTTLFAISRGFRVRVGII